MSANLRVEWFAGNQQWLIVGGYLPRGAAWAGFDCRAAALAEAYDIARDIGVDVDTTEGQIMKSQSGHAHAAHLLIIVLIVLGVALLAGCTTLAPGATAVRVTSHARDIGHCTPAGAVSVPFNPLPVNYIGLASNQVVALRADTLLVTVPFPGLQGVAYRCGS